MKIYDDKRVPLLESIQRFFNEYMDEEVGTLKSELLLDYFLREIGPVIYNQAITDAQAYFQEKTSDLEGTCYEPEFEFWKKAGKS